MADLDYEHFDGGFPAAASGHRLGRYAHLVGAVVSISLVIGGAVWAYQLAMRDVAGVPVIRAIGGPLRQAPANPGGAETMHQGLSVNAVAAAGTALPLPETLTLAPKPQDLAEEDLAGLDPLEPAGGPDAPLLSQAIDPLDPTPLDATPIDPLALPEMAPEALPATQEDAVAAALAEALGLDAATPRPQPRPGDVTASLDGAIAAPATAEIDPATIAPGTLLVQLGAFDNQDAARSEWARLTGTFTDLMAGKALVIQPAQSGGKTFYRLRAHGFVNDDDTRRFCTAMLAENATCIPVAQR